MKPGKELDALVAEKVIGTDISSIEKCANHDIDTYTDGKMFCFKCGWVGPKEGVKSHYRGFLIPRYSSDVSAAWEVVDKIKNKKFHDHFILTAHPGHWNCKILDRWPYYFVSDGDTAPHAICLAALRSVGYEFE